MRSFTQIKSPIPVIFAENHFDLNQIFLSIVLSIQEQLHINGFIFIKMIFYFLALFVAKLVD